MIKTRKGETVVDGNISEILADVAIIIDSVNEVLTEELGAEEAKKAIMEAVEYGLMSDDELKAQNKKAEEKLACELTEALDDLKKLLEGMMKDAKTD